MLTLSHNFHKAWSKNRVNPHPRSLKPNDAVISLVFPLYIQLQRFNAVTSREVTSAGVVSSRTTTLLFPRNGDSNPTLSGFPMPRSRRLLRQDLNLLHHDPQSCALPMSYKALVHVNLVHQRYTLNQLGLSAPGWRTEPTL